MKKRYHLIILSFSFLFFHNHAGALEVGLNKNYLRWGAYKFCFQDFIDARMSPAKPVGFTRVGISNKTEPMYTVKNFGAYCLKFFKGSIISFGNTKAFVAVINQITIQETHNGGSEFSTVSLAIDYFVVDSNQKCKLYYSSFVRTQDNSGLDITKKHSSNLTDAFSLSFDNLQTFMANVGVPFSDDSSMTLKVLSDSLSKVGDTVVFKNQIKNGLYFSGKQILKNAPQTDKWNFLSQIDTSMQEIFFEDKSKLPNNNALFAFKKNNELYLNIRKNTYRKVGIEDSTRFVYFKDLTRTRVSIGAGISSVGLGVFFGLVGYVAGEAVRHAGKITERIDRLYIDLNNGLMDIKP